MQKLYPAYVGGCRERWSGGVLQGRVPMPEDRLKGASFFGHSSFCLPSTNIRPDLTGDIHRMYFITPTHTALILFLLHTVSPLKLPNYIKPCKKTDPKLDECVVKHGIAAIPKFINGDSKYRVPRLEPLDITELRVRQGTKQVGLNMILKDCKIYGIKNTKFVKARTNLPGNHIEWDFKIPRIEILSDYEVEGQVLILPITGKGKANVTLTNLEITYKYNWVYENRNGKNFMNFTNSELLFDTGRTYFDLKNLFNGDQFLGSNMNRFLNENWKDVTKELGPAVGQAFSDVFRLLLTRIAAQVPFEEIYLN